MARWRETLTEAPVSILWFGLYTEVNHFAALKRQLPSSCSFVFNHFSPSNQHAQVQRLLQFVEKDVVDSEEEDVEVEEEEEVIASFTVLVLEDLQDLLQSDLRLVVLFSASIHHRNLLGIATGTYLL